MEKVIPVNISTCNLKLEGQWGIDEMHRLNDRLAEGQNGDQALVELNLEDVTYMNSASIGCIINFHNNLTRQGRALIVTVPVHIQRIFKLMELDHILHLRQGSAALRHPRRSTQPLFE